MDAASNLSKTIDRSRPAPRVCRRTGPCPPCKQQLLVHYAGPGPQRLVCCRWCLSNTRLSGLPTCLVLPYTSTYIRTYRPGRVSRAWGGGDDHSQRSSEPSISSCPTCICITRPTLPACLPTCLPACPHGSIVVNQRPSSFPRAGLAGLPGPMLQHSRLEPGSDKISELHPGPKTPAPPVFTTAVMTALVPSL